jgi:UDP-3-O-[3-hydroxymyristoyl] N-acetylglucosamine deacetylase
MQAPLQRTLAREFTVSGVGLHTGCRSSVTVSPAPANTGFSFVLSDGSRVAATPEAVRSTVRCTTVATATAELHTIEHVLAALVGMEIDNAIVAVDGPEVPIADGSALPFAKGIEDAGFIEQKAPRREFVVRTPVWHRDGDKLLVIVPSNEFKVNFFVSFPEPVGIQFLQTPALTPEYFLREIAPNRTFGFRAEVEALHAQGLALGGALDNAVVIDRDGYAGPLRFPDEIVRHKALDLIGDFGLLGMRLRGEVIALKSGHALHVAVAQSLRAPLAAAL